MLEAPLRLEWTDEFLTGDHNIDKHHKEMVDMLNVYCNLIKHEMNDSVVFDIINRISLDVTNHFKEEEDLMDSINCPDFDIHKKSHEDFLREFYSLKTDYEKGNSGAKHDLIMFILTYMKKHLTTLDKDMAACLKKAAIK